MNKEQMVNEVAKDLHEAWLRKPCWFSLAKHVLAEPEEQTDQCCSKASSLDDLLTQFFGPPIEDDGNFRLLNEGEQIEEGDQWMCGGVWRDLGDSRVIGMAVQASESVSLPQGHYRRPLENDGEQARGDFGWALSMLREGLAVRCEAWNDDLKIGLCPGDGPLLPTILLFDGGECGPFFPDHKDLLATDWTLA